MSIHMLLFTHLSCANKLVKLCNPMHPCHSSIANAPIHVVLILLNMSMGCNIDYTMKLLANCHIVYFFKHLFFLPWEVVLSRPVF